MLRRLFSCPAGAMPNAEVEEKSEVQGSWEKNEKDVPWKWQCRDQWVDQWIRKNTASKACLFLSCQRRAFGVIRRSATDPGPGHWQAWPLPASCQRTAAGEAAGLLWEDKASGRKREAETASSQSCPVTLTTNYPQRLWPPGHDSVCLCGCLGTRKSVSIDPIGNTGHIFGHFLGLFLFLSRAAINHFHFNFHFLSL